MSLPKIFVDVGFASPTVSATLFIVGDPARGKLGGPGTLGDGTVWTDITQYVRSWSVRRGATRGDDLTLRFDASTCSIDLNDGDRRFDPDNLSGPYALAGVSQVTPMRRVRIRAMWDGVTYPIFYGFADDWQPAYSSNSWTVTTLTATDAQKYFASYERIAGGPALGDNEDSGARISRILDGVSWPSPARIISTGDTLLQSTDLGGNALTELLLVQDTERGELYIDASGNVVFRNRQAIFTDTRSTTSQATFGDGGYATTGEIPYANATPSGSDEALANQVSVSEVGGTEQTVQDTDSIGNYLIKTFQRLDLIMKTDAEALNWAKAVLFQYSVPKRRFSSVDFSTPRPEVEDDFWLGLLGREFGDRITVLRRPAGGGSPIDRDCFVRGITHSSDGVAWTSQFTLQSADRYSFFVVGDPILGRLGYNALAY